MARYIHRCNNCTHNKISNKEAVIIISVISSKANNVIWCQSKRQADTNKYLKNNISKQEIKLEDVETINKLLHKQTIVAAKALIVAVSLENRRQATGTGYTHVKETSIPHSVGPLFRKPVFDWNAMDKCIELKKTLKWG